MALLVTSIVVVRVSMQYFLIYICIQIIGEALPISSSGHCLLFKQLAMMCGIVIPPVTTTVWFNHLLHIPTVLIITLFFSKRWLRWRFMLYHPWRYKKSILSLIGIVFIADGMTTISYCILKWSGIYYWQLSYGFLITSMVLYSLRFVPLYKTTVHHWRFTALFLGIAQSISLLPGISRFGITYVCARWYGHSAQNAFELSWLIGFPLMLAGSVHGLLELYFYGCAPEILHPQLPFIMLGATIVSWYALRYSYTMALRGTLYRCAYYLLIPWSLASIIYLCIR